jgi:hypothetical protein
MRTLPLTVVVLAAVISNAAAQLSVEIVTEQDQFLRDEGVPLKVRVTNRSGQTLRLGTDNDWLSFNVDSHEGVAIAKLGDVPVRGEFVLETAHVVTRQVDIAPSFDLTEPGRYTVTATVRVKDWASEISSKPKRIEVVRGTKIWEQEFGVPAPSGFPEVRRYILQQAQYQKQLRLYLRITDANDQSVFKVQPLGILVSFSRPEAQVDQNSDLNVIFQNGARSFQFLVVRPDGNITLRQTYDYTASRPSLRANDEGRIYVSGGARRYTANDLPVPLPPATNAVGAAITNVPAAPTNAPANSGKSDGKSRKK